MPLLQLKVRYFQDSTPADVPCREENFIHRELLFPLPLEQTALVLIDLWNVHHIQSWVERAEAVTRDVIAPLVDKARRASVPIIHAPSPRITPKYTVYPGTSPKPKPSPAPTWPPPEFRSRSGDYARFRGPREQPPGVGPYWDTLAEQIDLSPHVRVHESDAMIETGQQLHDLCEDKGILHLLVAGFATNWCILGRNYGIRAMRARGYNTIIVRDATEGVEFPDTLKDRWTTELAIREVEQVHGFSASSKDIHAACDAVLTDGSE